MSAVATVKIGPVKAKFKRPRVTLSDLDPPNGYKISGQGDGGVAGFAKGGATVKLTPKDGGTLLAYNVDAQIGGKLTLSNSASGWSTAQPKKSPMNFLKILPMQSTRRQPESRYGRPLTDLNCRTDDYSRLCRRYWQGCRAPSRPR